MLPIWTRPQPVSGYGLISASDGHEHDPIRRLQPMMPYGSGAA